tara:strand:- start:50708 stop:50944 length:237 start_codon:yes stop_codon:yes gene_type:complete
LLNLCLKTKNALINKKFIDRVIGIMESPYPIEPPEFLIVIMVNGKKYKLIRIIKIDKILFATFISITFNNTIILKNHI